MTDHVIDFKEDGSVESLYSNNINLGELGKQNMNRASHVSFNEETQKWDVEPVGYNKDNLPSEYLGYDTYEQAVAFEVELFNTARSLGVHNDLDSVTGRLVSRLAYDKINTI